MDQIYNGLVSPDEAELFDAIARKWEPLPKEIKRVYFRFGEDSGGDPAVWITAVVPEDLKPSKEKINALYEATQAFRNEVFQADTGRWPYIEIVTE